MDYNRVGRVKHMKKIFSVLIMLILAIMIAVPVMAASLGDDVNAEMGGFGEASWGTEEAPYLPTLIGNIIRVVLGLLGIVLLYVIIRGGFVYMTAGGDNTAAQKGKDWLKNGVIGIVIILMAYSLSSFVIRKIIESIGN